MFSFGLRFGTSDLGMLAFLDLAVINCYFIGVFPVLIPSSEDHKLPLVENSRVREHLSSVWNMSFNPIWYLTYLSGVDNLSGIENLFKTLSH